MGPAFLETLLSLTLQATVVIAVARFIANRLPPDAILDRYWFACHWMLLGQAVAAFGLPYLRILPHFALSDPRDYQAVLRWESAVAMVLLAVWLAGVVTLSASLFVSGWRIGRMIRDTEQNSRQPFDPLGASIGEVPNLRLLTNEKIFSPFCWQFHRPYILFPQRVQEFSAEEQQAILRHELEHLRAGHPLALFIQRLTEIVFWYHPLVWWTSRQANLHREFRCDAAAIRSAADKKSYLSSLLRLMDPLPPVRSLLPAGLGFGDQPSILRQRLDRIRKSTIAIPSSCPRPRFILIWILGIALCATTLRVPTNITANSRTLWSPWPRWTARCLQIVGIPVRDYELDGHRLRPHSHQ